MSRSPLVPAPGETWDRLAGDWRILQLARGHRFSTDDLLTAWEAANALPGARRLLDLGCGVGSVGLLALWRLEHPPGTAPPDDPARRLVGVEAQAVSVDLARRTVAANGLAGRVTILHGDLRDPDVLPPGRRYDLVTGSPPYIPPGKGLRSPHPQRAAARIELRGDVFDYCRAAARVLAPGGRFVFCHAAADPRPERAVAEAGLVLLARRDVVFRHGRPPLIAVFTCGWEGARTDPPPLAVRGPDGRWTPGMLAIRTEMGGPPLRHGEPAGR